MTIEQIVEQQQAEQQAPVEGASPDIAATPAPQTEPAAEAPRARSARDEMMAEILARRREELNAETGGALDQGAAEGEDGGGEPAAGEVPPTAPVEQPAAPTEPPPAGASAQPGADDDPLMEIKVNGVIHKRPRSEVIRLAQMGEAGQRALGVAHDRQKRIEELEAELARRPAPQAQPAAQPAVDDIDFDDATIEAMQFGSKEEQKAALKEIVRKARAGIQPAAAAAPVIDPRQIVQAVRQDIDFDSAVERVGTEFSEVFKDEDLTKLVASRVQSIRTAELHQGLNRSPYDVMREAAAHVRDKFVRAPDARPTASAAPQNSNGASAQVDQGAREDAKRRLVTGPAAPLARMAPPSGEARPLSENEQRQKAIDEIKRARGQA